MSLLKVVSPLTSPCLLRTAATASFASFPFPSPPLASPASPGSHHHHHQSALSLEALRASLQHPSSPLGLDPHKLSLPPRKKDPLATGPIHSTTRKVSLPRARGTDVGSSSISSLFGQLASFDTHPPPSHPPNAHVPSSIASKSLIPAYASLGASGAPTPLCSPALPSTSHHAVHPAFIFPTDLFSSSTDVLSTGKMTEVKTTLKGRARRASFKVDLPELLSEERLLREAARPRRVSTPFAAPASVGEEGEGLLMLA